MGYCANGTQLAEEDWTCEHTGGAVAAAVCLGQEMTVLCASPQETREAALARPLPPSQQAGCGLLGLWTVLCTV